MRLSVFAGLLLIASSLVPAYKAGACTYSTDCFVSIWALPDQFPLNGQIGFGTECDHNQGQLELWKGGEFLATTDPSQWSHGTVLVSDLNSLFSVTLHPGDQIQIRPGESSDWWNINAEDNFYRNYQFELVISSNTEADSTPPVILEMKLESGAADHFPGPCSEDDEPVEEILYPAVRFDSSNVIEDRTPPGLLRYEFAIWTSPATEPDLSVKPEAFRTLDRDNSYGGLNFWYYKETGSDFVSWAWVIPSRSQGRVHYQVRLRVMDGSGNVSEPTYGEVELEWPEPVANDDDDDDDTTVEDSGGSDGGSCSQSGGSGFSMWLGPLVVLGIASILRRGRRRHTLLVVLTLALVSLLPAREAGACTYSEDCTVFSWNDPDDFPANAHLVVGDGCSYDDPHDIQLWSGESLLGEITAADLQARGNAWIGPLGDLFEADIAIGSPHQITGRQVDSEPSSSRVFWEIPSVEEPDMTVPWISNLQLEAGFVKNPACRCPDECDEQDEREVMGVRADLSSAGDDRTPPRLMRYRLMLWENGELEPVPTTAPNHYRTALSTGGVVKTDSSLVGNWPRSVGKRKYNVRLVLMDGSGNVSEPVDGKIELEWPEPSASDDDDDDDTTVEDSGGSDGGSCSQSGGAGFSLWWGLLVVLGIGSILRRGPMRHALLAVIALALASLLPVREAGACTPFIGPCQIIPMSHTEDFPENSHVEFSSECAYDEPTDFQLWSGEQLLGEVSREYFRDPQNPWVQTLSELFDAPLVAGSPYRIMASNETDEPRRWDVIFEIPSLAEPDNERPWAGELILETAMVSPNSSICDDDDDALVPAVLPAHSGFGDDRTPAELMRYEFVVWEDPQQEPESDADPASFRTVLLGGPSPFYQHLLPEAAGTEGRHRYSARLRVMDGSGNVSEPVYGEFKVNSGGSDGGSCSQAGISLSPGTWALVLLSLAGIRIWMRRAFLD